MADSTEQGVRDALRAHRGGLGPSLSEEDKEQIINGRPNEAENKNPFDGDKFSEGIVASLERHPVAWILK